MFLLQALELFLGDIEQWPSTIFNHLFIDDPTPDIVQRDSVFFYGNNIPILLLAISTKSVTNIAETMLLILCTVIILYGGEHGMQNILLYTMTRVSNVICILTACVRPKSNP